jgi:deoxyribonuclease-4
MSEMRSIGVHVSIAGGVYHAFDDMRELSINAFQIFLKSSNRWQDKPYKKEDIDKFKEECRANPEVKIFAHSAYLINPAADDATNRHKSLDALVDEMNRAEKLGIAWLVLHPGSHKGTGTDSGISRAVDLIDKAFEKCHSTTGILLETTAGQGNAIGCTFDDLAQIIDESKNKSKFGVCLDTCHVFSAGYDFTTSAGLNLMISEFDRIIGLNKLKLIHCNDSKYDVGTNKDRHEHIGKGKIGEEGLRILLNHKKLVDVPVILETPKDGTDKYESDRENLKKIMKLLA